MANIPFVTNVTSTAANGVYSYRSFLSYDTITITVTFSENVIVNTSGLGSEASISLNSGGKASFSGGSGTNTLKFLYTVGSSHDSIHLDYTSSGALKLNDSTIEDATGNNANLILPEPNTAGSLGANKNLIINKKEPVIIDVKSTDANGNYINGTYKIGDKIPIKIIFSKNVTVTNSPQIVLNSGSTVNYSRGSGSNELIFEYTVASGDITSELDYTSTSALSFNNGTIKESSYSYRTATLTMPTPGNSGSLGYNNNIIIDGKARYFILNIFTSIKTTSINIKNVNKNLSSTFKLSTNDIKSITKNLYSNVKHTANNIKQATVSIFADLKHSVSNINKNVNKNVNSIIDMNTELITRIISGQLTAFKKFFDTKINKTFLDTNIDKNFEDININKTFINENKNKTFINAKINKSFYDKEEK